MKAIQKVEEVIEDLAKEIKYFGEKVREANDKVIIYDEILNWLKADEEEIEVPPFPFKYSKEEEEHDYMKEENPSKIIKYRWAYLCSLTYRGLVGVIENEDLNIDSRKYDSNSENGTLLLCDAIAMELKIDHPVPNLKKL